MDGNISENKRAIIDPLVAKRPDFEFRFRCFVKMCTIIRKTRKNAKEKVNTGPKGCQLEVRARRATRLQEFHIQTTKWSKGW